MNLLSVFDETFVNEESTYSLTFGDMLGSSCYAVCDMPERDVRVSLEKFNLSILKDFVQNNIDILCEEDRALGTWVDGDRIVHIETPLLLSKDDTDIDTIIELLEKYNQKCAYDLETKEELYLETFKEKRA